jgi:hypothetical protein
MKNGKIAALALLLSCITMGVFAFVFVEIGISKHEYFSLFIYGSSALVWFFWQFVLKRFDK